MKTLPLLLALICLATPLVAFAQQPGAPRVRAQERQFRELVKQATPDTISADAGDDLKRFDLEFPGGTPGELVTAISKALGQPLNAIIPTEQEATRIMPIKVHGVTVPELFKALQSASVNEQPLVTGIQSGMTPGGGGGRGRSIQFKTVEMGFRPNTTHSTDQTVWSFYSTAPTPDYLAAIADTQPSDQMCKYFQLAGYLEGHSVEDITTAIQTGWKMLKVEPLPQLSFHQETKLLIAVGPQQHIEQIPAVLQQLQRDSTLAVEKIAKWHGELAEVEEKKQPGWEQKAGDLKHRIWAAARAQHAREEIENPQPDPGFIQATKVRPPQRSISQ